MSISFQADNDLKFGIVKDVRRRELAVDFASAQEAQLDGLSDREVLDYAAHEGRVLVSHDRRTMIDHFHDRLVDGKTSPGLLIVSQGADVGPVVDSILYIWALCEANELYSQAYYLPSISRHVFVR